MISDRFEDFSQSLRVFIEQKMRFMQLFLIDTDEAVGNLEHACAGMLNSFHSLYDACSANPEVQFDFYGSPLCCFVLAYRNAKHHNKANGIRSIYRYASMNPERKPYLLVDYPAGSGEEGGGFTDHYASWGDFEAYLNLRDNRLRAGARELIRNRISATAFERFSQENGVPPDNIFINVIPIIIGAGSECIPYLSPQIRSESTEARHFVWHFLNVGIADFDNPEYTELESSVFR